MEVNGHISLQEVLNQITDSVIVVDPAGKVLYYNGVAHSYRDLFTAEIKRGAILYEILSKDVGTAVKEFVDRTAEDSISQSGQVEVKHPAGHTFFFDVNFTPITDDRHSIHGICIVSRDITVQKNFERKNLLLITELSTLIEKANAIIFSVDSQGYVTEWNQQCEEITGCPKEGVLGSKSDFLNGRHGGRQFDAVLRRILKGESVTNYELLFQADHREITFLINGTPKRSPDGKVIGALFIGQDVSELMAYRLSLEKQVKDRTEKLKEALEKEKELVDIKNKFVSIVSHEFKLPLNAIGNSVEMLQSDSPASGRHLESIRQHVDNMKLLLEDVLHIEKHETAKLKPKIGEVDLKAFLHNLVNEVGGATSNTHQFITFFPDKEVSLKSDEKLLRNIFINLLSNAVKFSPHHHEVHIMMSAGESSVFVIVRDFGLGMDDADLEKLFQPFSRGSNAQKISGTGLGLSIVKRAVTALGGSIKVESTPHNGSTFTVELPLAPGDGSGL
jgi:PAS domain S-box-containing protein